MVTVTFILDTDVDKFASWLQQTWQPFAGTFQMDELRDIPSQQKSPRQLIASGFDIHHTRDGESADRLLETAVLFELFPDLAHEKRIKVRAECNHPRLLPWFNALLSDVAQDSSDTMRILEVNVWPAWFEFAENETYAKMLEDFARRIDQLKTIPSHRAAEPPRDDGPRVRHRAGDVRALREDDPRRAVTCATGRGRCQL